MQLAHSGKLGKLHTLYASVYTPEIDNAWLPGEPTPARDVVDWDLWLGPAPWRPYNQQYVDGGWRGYWDFDSGARLLDWGAHTVDLCQWANQADDTMPVEYEPSEKNITAHYANGVKLVLDFLETPFGDAARLDHSTWAPARCGSSATRAGSRPATAAGSGQAASLAEGAEPLPSKTRGLDVAAHARNFFDCIKSRQPTAANPEVMRTPTSPATPPRSPGSSRQLRLDPERRKRSSTTPKPTVCVRARPGTRGTCRCKCDTSSSFRSPPSFGNAAVQFAKIRPTGSFPVPSNRFGAIQ